MKKVLIKIFTFILALCCVGLVACNNTEQKPSATLVGFENSTVEISYGMNYNIADYVYDSEGNRYAVSASVTDNDGNAVEADGFFQVLKASYKVVYSVEFGGENKTSTVTVKGISTPVIEFADAKEQTYTIGILPAELPAITASDIIDGTITSITKEVYKQTSFENKKMEDYDGFSNYYMPKELGTYFWKVTVTNSNGQSNTRLLYFYVTTDPGEYDLLVEEGGETQFKCAKDLTYDVVSFSEIPTEGIVNEIGYNGHAYKIGNVPHNADITVPFGYTAKEYIALEQRGMFNAVQFYYMIDSTRHPTRTKCGNNDQRIPENTDESFNGNYSFFSSAGYYAIRKSAESDAIKQEGRYITTNEWQVATVHVSDFVKCLGTGKTAKFIRTFMFGSTDTVDIYLSDVKFINYDWTKVPYKGAYDLKINETNFSRVTVSGQGATVEYVANADFPTEYNWKDTVKDEDGDVIKDTVLDEFGNPVLDANGNHTTKNRLVEVIGNVKNNVGYAGNAAKVYIPTNNKWVYVNFNYTGNEYLRLEQEGKFNAVKFTVMSESGLNNNDVNLMAQAGFAKKTLIKGEWKTYILSIEDFVKAFEDPNTTKATLYRSYLTNGFEHDFYVGDFEFITYDFNHEHTGGTATCSSKAICEICFQEYGDTLPHTEKTPATCTVKAVCDVCGESYGELAPHTEKEEIPAVNPTATTAGTSAKVVCEVCDEVLSEQETIPALNYVPAEDNVDSIYVTGQGYSKGYVANADIPTTGIANAVKYNGNAIKIGTVSNAKYIYLTTGYNKADIAKYAAANGYTAVKFSIMVEHASVKSLTNNSTAGLIYNVTGSKGIATNKWMTYVATIDQLVAAYENDTAERFAIISKTYQASGSANIYIGSFEFIEYDFAHTHEGGSATCLEYAVCTICGMPYGELAAHTEKVEEEGTLPSGTTAGVSDRIVCELCGTLISEKEDIPALNFNATAENLEKVSDTRTAHVAKEFVENSAIATEGIANPINFAGDAFKMTLNHNVCTTVTLPYTGTELARLADKGAFNAIKFSYMIDPSVDIESITNSKSADNFFLLAGYNGQGGTRLIQNKWVTHVIPAANILDAYADPDTNVLRFFYTYTKVGGNNDWFDFYFSGIEFITIDLEHTCAGGEATCVQKAICSTCGQEYGELTAHVGGTATCEELAICTVCGEGYGELAPHTEKVEIEGTAPTATETGTSAKVVCEVCEEVLSEAVTIPALNYVPVAGDIAETEDSTFGNVDVPSKTTVEFFAAGSLPTEMTYGEGQSVAIDNSFGYAGPAIRIQTASSGRGATLAMPYTGEQYKAYMEENGYTAVKVWMALGEVGGTLSSPAGSMIKVFGTERNKWVPVYLTVDQFVGTFGYRYKGEGASDASSFQADPTYNTIVYRANAYSAGITWALHIGTMEFVEYDFDHAHTGGTATCEKLAVCSICYQPYGELAAHTESIEIPGVVPTGTTAGKTDKITCSVCFETLQEQKDLPALNWNPSADDESLVSGVANVSTYTYYAPGSVPTSRQKDTGTTDPEGNPIYDTVTFDNSIGYTGSAIEITGYSNAKWASVSESAFNYTHEELVALAEDGVFTHVRFFFLLAANGGGNNGNDTSASVLQRAGFKNTSTPRDTWTIATVTAADFLDIYSSGKYYLFRLQGTGITNASFFVGNIEFFNLANDASLIDLSKYAKTQMRQIVCKTDGDGALQSTVAKHVWKENLPAKSAYTHNEADISYDHGDYQFAYQFEVASNGAIYLNLAYTADQIKVLATEKGYTEITFTFLADAAYHSNGLLNTREGGEGAMGTMSSSTCNTIVTKTWTIDEFCGFMGKAINAAAGYTTSPVVISDTEVLLNFGFRGGTTYLYIYDLSFVDPALA